MDTVGMGPFGRQNLKIFDPVRIRKNNVSVFVAKGGVEAVNIVGTGKSQMFRVLPPGFWAISYDKIG